MRTSLAISSSAHAGVLLLGLVSFGVTPFDTQPVESLPVDIITPEQFSELTKGQKNAPKVETAKPLAEKIGEEKRVEHLAKNVDKKDIVTAAAEPQPAPPAKPDIKADAKKEQPKVDAIAEQLKKEEAKKQPKPDPKPTPATKPAPPQPKFDADRVAALLDKHDPMRQFATADTLSSVPSLGVTSGTAMRLSQSEIDALRARLRQMWNIPPGVTNPDDLVVKVRIQLTRDRKLAGPIAILTQRPGMVFAAVQESVARAIVMAQPFDMLRSETYEQWRDMEITFDPREMFAPG
jgi:colicin import membrane protein